MLRVSVAGDSPTAIRLVEFTLLANGDSREAFSVADRSTADSEDTHHSAEAALNLTREDTGELAAPGYYGLDVMVSLLNCATGAVHLNQPVHITG
jgi:hypothetical protein